MAAFDYHPLSSPDDGTEGEVAGGGFNHIGPGHDAWVVDDEPTVIVEFQTAPTGGAEGADAR